MQEEEGRGAKPAGSLDGEGYYRSGEERGRGVDSRIVLAFIPFALGGGSVSCQVGEGGRFLVLRCGRVSDDDIDEEGISTLDILDVSAGTARIAITVVDLADYVLHAEVGLLDAGVEFLDKLVELISDGVVTSVAYPLVETTAEGMKRVFSSVEGLVARAHTVESRGVVGRADTELGSGDASELVGGEVDLRAKGEGGVDEAGGAVGGA